MVLSDRIRGESWLSKMTEYFKGITATLGAALMTVLVFLEQVQGWLPVVIAAINAVLVILVPNTRDGKNVRN